MELPLDCRIVLDSRISTGKQSILNSSYDSRDSKCPLSEKGQIGYSQNPTPHATKFAHCGILVYSVRTGSKIFGCSLRSDPKQRRENNAIEAYRNVDITTRLEGIYNAICYRPVQHYSTFNPTFPKPLIPPAQIMLLTTQAPKQVQKLALYPSHRLPCAVPPSATSLAVTLAATIDVIANPTEFPI